MNIAWFKTRLLAGTCLPWPTPKMVAAVQQKIALAVFRMIEPGSGLARLVGCPCRFRSSLVSDCEYHGRSARMLIHGR